MISLKKILNEAINEFMMPRDVDSKMKELGIKKIPISSQGEQVLKGMVKEKFLDKITNTERLIYFVESLGDEKFGYGSKGKPLSPLVDRFWNDITSEAIFFGGKIAAYQVAMNIKDMKRNGEQLDSPYQMMKEYFKNFGMEHNRSRVFDSAIRNLEEWMKRNKIQESELKGYLAADVVDDIVKAIGSKMVKGHVENAPNRNYIYLKLTDIKFGNDVVKMLKSKFGIDAKIDKTFGNIPTVSFASKKVVSEKKSDYEVYHKSYTSAIEAAREYAEKKGYEINNDDAFTKIGMGPRKPSEGKTNRFDIELSKDGKVQRKKLQIQVYGMRNSYELNAYIQ